MDLFPVGLDNSLFPAILLGVLVTFAATETLGWSFTGLVVPGYLAAVGLVSKRAAGLMVVESLVTVLLVRALSDATDRLRISSRFFGRERFFLTLAVATGVRLSVETAVLPLAAAHAGDLGALAIGGGDLSAHSIGLVLVPLMSHTLDKVGPLRGLAQIGALTGVTGALVAGLVRATNLTLADLSLTFEDVAFSIDRSPKAYVVLLTGALLAARANVAYGWDFHGIVVPGLLAVAWFEPVKVLLTLGEAFAALVVARAALRLPGLRHAPVEGPRRLVLVFCSDAALRVGAVAVMGRAAPWLAPSDLYGFGYLLPTLLAVKIWQRHSTFRVLLPATQVSLGGFLLGNALVVLFGACDLWLAGQRAARKAAPVGHAQPFERAVLLGRSRVARAAETTITPPEDLRAWREAFRRLAGGHAPAEAFAPLGERGYAFTPLSDEPGGLAVHEAPARLVDLVGTGTFVARPGGRTIIVAVPRPLDPAATLAAVDIARALDARAVAVAGTSDERTDPFATALARTPFAAARRELAGAGWLWLEILVDEAAPAGGELRVPPGPYPRTLDAAALRAVLPSLRVRWADGATLVLSAPARTWREVVTTSCGATAEAASALAPLSLLGAGTRAADDLDVTEALAFAEEIVAPLAEGARTGHGAQGHSACRAARALGLEVVTTADEAGTRYVSVVPRDRAAAAVVLRLGPPAGPTGETIVGAPAAAREPYTAPAAHALFEALGGRALVVGARNGRQATAYEAATEVLATAFGTVTVLEVRGGGEGAAPLAQGAVLSWGGVPGAPARAPDWIGPLEQGIRDVGLESRPFDGSAELACCGDFRNPLRSRFLRVPGRHVATLFLSARVRQDRFGDDGLVAAAALAAESGLPREDGRLDLRVRAAIAAAPPGDAAGAAKTLELARRYAELRHVADLRALAMRPGVRLVVDATTGERVVVAAVRDAAGVTLAAVNLRERGSGSRRALELPPGAPLGDGHLRALRHGGLSSLFAARLFIGDPR